MRSVSRLVVVPAGVLGAGHHTELLEASGQAADALHQLLVLAHLAQDRALVARGALGERGGGGRPGQRYLVGHLRRRVPAEESVAAVLEPSGSSTKSRGTMKPMKRGRRRVSALLRRSRSRCSSGLCPTILLL